MVEAATPRLGTVDLAGPRVHKADSPKVAIEYVLRLDQVGRGDVARVGGKCANLGELLHLGVQVPPGFAVTVEAFRKFLHQADLTTRIAQIISDCNGSADPSEYVAASNEIRSLIEAAPMPTDVADAIASAYRALAQEAGEAAPRVAVRSSATAEDSAEASFAGQQETFLNVHGEDQVLRYVQRCWSSLYTPRAIFYRHDQGIPPEAALIAVGVQRLIPARSAGVVFTLDPVTGDRSRIVLESVWGLGEALVGGRVRPDHFVVDRDEFTMLKRTITDKPYEIVPAETDGGLTIEQEVPSERASSPSLDDEQVVALAEIARRIEDHYNSPQDIEFALEDGEIYVLQARPETVWSRKGNGGSERAAPRPEAVREIDRAEDAKPILEGLPASPGVHAGPANVVISADEAGGRMKDGDVLVTKMTNPDWVPYMRRAGAIVTEDGGATCHAAIVSREMGVPCIVGARDATRRLETGKEYTVDAKAGLVYAGRVTSLLEKKTPAAPAANGAAPVPITATKVYANVSLPEIAEKVARETPADGVGLLRAEHMLLGIGKHPKLLLEEGGGKSMVDAFAANVRTVAAAFSPRPIVYRFLDFKPDEFLNLAGGERFERDAGHVGTNPLMGFRGCFRYTKEPEIFRLECQAIRRVRQDYRLRNVNVMIPFVRTVEELRYAKRIMEDEGLVRGPDFKVWIMVEVPSTVLCIDQFLDEGIDGVSFGTNDLTMLILGADRDDASVAEVYDERNPAVLRAMSHVIRVCQERGVTTSICGQAPSNYPEVVEFLLREGATSLSVNPDRVIETKHLVAQLERKLILEASRARLQNGNATESGLTRAFPSGRATP